ncbi:unnamed protein product [Cuscuta campestris]|uniref:Uncharacterized protein n=1 Tax=Cuscuta campestris TaxID=132261 RepID=A0A484MXV2_9ASTE|nr:unnamed protein product [Cuscuta campestris]
MAGEQKKKKVRGAGKCEKLYKRRREGHPPIELEWEGGEPAMSEKNRDIQKKNPYPHFMGRDGYAMLQRELVASQATTSADIAGSSTETGSQLGREDSWLRGHTPGRQLEVTDPPLMEIRDRIVQLKKEVVAVTFVPDGHNVVLTRALGTAEHPGRTRGVGSYSGLCKVFKGNMKPRKPEDFASMSQHTPSVAPHYGQRSSKAPTDFVDFTDLTDVASFYLRISDPADYIVAHGSIFPRVLGDVVHGVPISPPSPPETVADCEGSFVAWPKSLVGLGDPPYTRLDMVTSHQANLFLFSAYAPLLLLALPYRMLLTGAHTSLSGRGVESCVSG